MGYWRGIAQAAAQQALKDAKLDSAVSAVIALMAQGLIAVGIYFALGAFTNATAVGRLFTAFTPFMTFPAAFLIRLLLEPATHFRSMQTDMTAQAEQMQARIQRLENPNPPIGGEASIYQDGRAVGHIVGQVSVNGSECEFQEIESCTADFSRAFAFGDEILYFKQQGNSANMLIDGPNIRMNVRMNVKAHVLGKLSSVRLPV